MGTPILKLNRLATGLLAALLGSACVLTFEPRLPPEDSAETGLDAPEIAPDSEFDASTDVAIDPEEDTRADVEPDADVLNDVEDEPDSDVLDDVEDVEPDLQSDAVDAVTDATDVVTDAPDAVDADADSGAEDTPEDIDTGALVCERPFAPHVSDPADCNANGRADTEELAEGISFDCNINGVLDECERLEAACSTFGLRDFTEYRAGNLPVIVVVPFSGTLRPEDVPDRISAGVLPASNTDLLGEALSASLEELTGGVPHMIFSHLHIDKLYFGTVPVGAHDGHPAAARALDEFNSYLDAAARSVEHNFGTGLFVYLIGHNDRSTIELGYGPNGSQLNGAEERLAHSALSALSGIQAIVESGGLLSDVVRGPESLGATIQSYGYSVFPSPIMPTTDFPDAYLNGGYVFRRITLLSESVLSGVQVQTPLIGVRDTGANRASFAEALGDGVVRFLDHWQNVDAAAASLVGVRDLDPWASEEGDGGSVAVFREGDLSEAIEVPLVWSGSATGGDVEALPPSVAFDPGVDSVEVAVTPIPDDVVEGPELLTVNVARSGGFNVMPGASSIRISDSGSTAFTLELSNSVLQEGGSAITVTATRDRCVGGSTKQIQVSGWASFAADLIVEGAEVVIEGTESATIAVTFEGDDPSASFDVRARADGEIEGRELLVFSVPGDQVEAWIEDADADELLVGWWGTSRYGRSYADLSMGGRDLTPHPAGLAGPAVRSESGVNFLSFDGVDDLAIIPDFPLASSITLVIEFRIPPGADERFAYLWGHGHLSFEHNLNVFVTPEGTLRTSLRGEDEAADFDALDVDGNFRDGEWHQYALRLDRIGASAEVFLDGELQSSSTRGSLLDPSFPIVLGNRYDLGLQRHWVGDVGSVRLYSRPLSSGELGSLP